MNTTTKPLKNAIDPNMYQYIRHEDFVKYVWHVTTDLIRITGHSERAGHEKGVQAANALIESIGALSAAIFHRHEDMISHIEQLDKRAIECRDAGRTLFSDHRKLLSGGVDSFDLPAETTTEQQTEPVATQV
jgi:hypothetical protein